MNGFDLVQPSPPLPVTRVREHLCQDRHCPSDERGEDKMGFNRLQHRSSLPVIRVRERRSHDRHCHSNERGEP